MNFLTEKINYKLFGYTSSIAGNISFIIMFPND